MEQLFVKFFFQKCGYGQKLSHLSKHIVKNNFWKMGETEFKFVFLDCAYWKARLNASGTFLSTIQKPCNDFQKLTFVLEILTADMTFAWFLKANLTKVSPFVKNCFNVCWGEFLSAYSHFQIFEAKTLYFFHLFSHSLAYKKWAFIN